MHAPIQPDNARFMTKHRADGMQYAVSPVFRRVGVRGYLPVAVGGVSREMPVIGRWVCISGFLRWRLFGECGMGAFLRTVVRDARLNP